MTAEEKKDGASPKPRFLWALRAWWWLRSWGSGLFLRWSLRLDDSVCRGFIMERANELALSGVMAFLEKEGLTHCSKCPTRGPLQKLFDKYWCKKHLPIIMPEEALKNGGLSHARA